MLQVESVEPKIERALSLGRAKSVNALLENGSEINMISRSITGPRLSQYDTRFYLFSKSLTKINNNASVFRQNKRVHNSLSRLFKRERREYEPSPSSRFYHKIKLPAHTSYSFHQGAAIIVGTLHKDSMKIAS
jgi:hypothetical protein